MPPSTTISKNTNINRKIQSKYPNHSESINSQSKKNLFFHIVLSSPKRRRIRRTNRWIIATWILKSAKTYWICTNPKNKSFWWNWYPLVVQAGKIQNLWSWKRWNSSIRTRRGQKTNGSTFSRSWREEGT